MFIKDKGSGIDIHKMIGKIPLRPKKGFVVPGYRYLGPYNPLQKQIIFDPTSGEIQKIIQQRSNELDRIAMTHDICYSINPESKSSCDREMAKSIDTLPYRGMNKMAMVTRTIINKKQQLGLGQGVKKNHTKLDIEDRQQYAKKCINEL